MNSTFDSAFDKISSVADNVTSAISFKSFGDTASLFLQEWPEYIDNIKIHVFLEAFSGALYDHWLLRVSKDESWSAIETSNHWAYGASAARLACEEIYFDKFSCETDELSANVKTIQEFIEIVEKFSSIFRDNRIGSSLIYGEVDKRCNQTARWLAAFTRYLVSLAPKDDPESDKRFWALLAYTIVAGFIYD